ncbi:MAG: hypothetical protein FD161_2398 [Limisphaerales bacterium]|nr:MAG: hypothetical protein FD161_2398 [Limisphaerales bacterium]KAG0508731.1 MAG: hypothetical protein E1N63_2149 [Limisphaerales bacterium]TXT50381.1 MAG: hypothetical protein FD140_2452 [Limisphaerales bacterium]
MLLLFVGCGTASANGVVPLLTAFTRPETALLTLGLTAGIILFEAWLLRRLFREGTYVRWLRVSAIINVASSLAGSVYLWMFKDAWQLMSLGFSAVFELFLLTVVVEGALLCRLAGSDKSNTATTVLRGVGLNFISYAGLFVLQIGFVFALIGWGSHTDKQRLAQWQDKSVLEGASGYIYAIGRGTNSGGRGLKRFDVAAQRWESLVAKSPEFNPLSWDVVGDTFACFSGVSHHGGSEIRIYRLPDFEPVRVISFNSSEFRLSPDARLVAAVANSGEAVAQKDGSGYYEFGRKGSLKVFNLDTGDVVAESKRMGLNRGLAWSSDGREVFFVSFLDEAVFGPGREQMRGSTSYGHVSFDGPHAQGIYALTIASGEVRLVTKGIYPEVVNPGGQLWFQAGKGLRVREANGQERGMDLSDLSHRLPSLSPDGKSAVMQVQGRTPFQGKAFLTVFRVSAPEKRLIVDAESIYHYRWAVGSAAVTAKQP